MAPDIGIIPSVRYLILGESPSVPIESLDSLALSLVHDSSTSSSLCIGGSNERYKDIVANISGKRGVPDSQLKRSGSTVAEEDYRFFDTFELDLRKAGFTAYICRSQQEVTTHKGEANREERIVAVVQSPMVSGIQQPDYVLMLDNVDFDLAEPNDIAGFWKPLLGARQTANVGELLMTVMKLSTSSEIFRYQTDDELKVQIGIQEYTVKFPGQPHLYKLYEIEVRRIGVGEKVDVRTVCNYLGEAHGKYLLCAPELPWTKALRLMRGEKLEVFGTAAEHGAEYLNHLLSGSQ